MATPHPGETPNETQYPKYPGVAPESDPQSGPPPNFATGSYPTGPPAGYGSQPYGTPNHPVPPPAGGPGLPGHYGYNPGLRPTTVSVAAWVTIALSALCILCGAIAALGSSALVDYMRENPVEAGLSSSDMQNLDDAELGFVVIGITMVFSGIAAIVVAAFVLKRQNWARITLVVMAGVTVLFGIPGAIMTFIGTLWLLGAIAVIVLLFVGGANAWFAPQGAAPSPGAGGYPPPGPYHDPYQLGPHQQNPYQPGPYDQGQSSPPYGPPPR